MEGLKLNEWLEINYKDEEKREEVLDSICEVCFKDNAYSDDKKYYEAEMGFKDEEDVANGYFRDDRYSIYAYIVKFENIFLLATEDEDECIGEALVFDDIESANEKLEKLENSLCASIENKIKHFEENIGDYSGVVDIKVKREYNNGGKFYSFNVSYEDNLLLDGAFSLDAESVLEIIKDYEKMTEELTKHGIVLDKIYKSKDSIGFSRYYNLELSKKDSEGYWNSVEREICISGTLQGATKKVVDFIDIDEIIEEFKELEENK